MAPILDPVNFFWVFSLLGHCEASVSASACEETQIKNNSLDLLTSPQKDKIQLNDDLMFFSENS